MIQTMRTISAVIKCQVQINQGSTIAKRLRKVMDRIIRFKNMKIYESD